MRLLIYNHLSGNTTQEHQGDTRYQRRPQEKGAAQRSCSKTQRKTRRGCSEGKNQSKNRGRQGRKACQSREGEISTRGSNPIITACGNSCTHNIWTSYFKVSIGIYWGASPTSDFRRQRSEKILSRYHIVRSRFNFKPGIRNWSPKFYSKLS